MTLQSSHSFTASDRRALSQRFAEFAEFRLVPLHNAHTHVYVGTRRKYAKSAGLSVDKQTSAPRVGPRHV
jgi:Zn/Cd-binding protein ZinT